MLDKEVFSLQLDEYLTKCSVKVVSCKSQLSCKFMPLLKLVNEDLLNNCCLKITFLPIVLNTSLYSEGA